jgi:iron(III) transport system permease protein
LGTFAIPQVMGAPAGFVTITTRIYSDLSLGSDPRTFVEAVTLAVFLVAVTVIIVAPADLVLAARLKLTRTSTADATWRGARRFADWAVAAVIGGYLLLSSGLPLLALVSAAITRAVGVASTPSNWTVDNFAVVWTPRTAEAIGRSLTLALAAASILLLLGGCAAALERTWAGRSVGAVVTLTLVLPGSTLAIGLLISYGRWLADTPAIILLAYLAKLWAVAHRPIAGALDRLPPEELRAARASGAGLLTGLSTVVLPPLRPALLAAWGLCFLTALHEVTMSSLLYGPGSETLAVVVLNSADLGRVGVTSALSVTVTLLVVLPGTALWVLGRRGAHA